MAWSLPDLVRRSADRAGDHPAVRSAGQQWTYAELAARAEDMAMLLLDHGLDRGDRVAIYMRRGFDSMAAINGVMLAGGAYVPLDSAAPPDRLAAVLADCDVHHVVVSPEHRDGLRQVLKSWSQVDLVVGAGPDDGLPVALAVPWPAGDGYRSGAPIDVRVIEDDLALIFYTSGTTGRLFFVASLTYSFALSFMEFRFLSFSLASISVVILLSCRFSFFSFSFL